MLKDIGTMLSYVDPLLGIIGILLGVVVAIVFFILGLRAHRPKLIAGGGGAATIQVPGKDIMASSVQFYNHPSYWGMKIPRETAKIDHARLYDPVLKEYVGPVLMWNEPGTSELKQRTSIEAGKSATLYLFAKERYNKEYLILQGTALNAELIVPATQYSEEKRDFSVVLLDEIGREYRFDITVRNGDQHVSAGFKLTWHARRQMIADAFRSLRGAFSLRR